MGAMKWQAQITVKSITDKLACDINQMALLFFADAVHQRHQVDRQMFNSYLSDWLCTWRDSVVGGKKNRVGKRKKNGGGGDATLMGRC